MVLTDVLLPEACRALVAGKLGVGLETQLAVERRLDLALVSTRAGEERAAELGLDEELGVERRGRRVERKARLRRVDVVRAGNRMAACDGRFMPLNA